MLAAGRSGIRNFMIYSIDDKTLYGHQSKVQSKNGIWARDKESTGIVRVRPEGYNVTSYGVYILS